MAPSSSLSFQSVISSWLALAALVVAPQAWVASSLGAVIVAGLAQPAQAQEQALYRVTLQRSPFVTTYGTVSINSAHTGAVSSPSPGATLGGAEGGWVQEGVVVHGQSSSVVADGVMGGAQAVGTGEEVVEVMVESTAAQHKSR